MSMFYCFTCDRPKDSDYEDHADYSDLDNLVCGDCVDALEEQKNNWWQQLDNDEQAIKDFCRG